MLLMAFVLGVGHIMRDCIVHIDLHVRPIVLLSKRNVHTTLSGVYGYRKVLGEVKDACTECC